MALHPEPDGGGRAEWLRPRSAHANLRGGDQRGVVPEVAYASLPASYRRCPRPARAASLAHREGGVVSDLHGDFARRSVVPSARIRPWTLTGYRRAGAGHG